MAAFADSVARPPRTLDEREQVALLRATGQHRSGFRDHVLFSMALGTALREHEILALNVGDVFEDTGKARRRIQLRVFKRSNPSADAQEVVLPDALRAKVDKFTRWKQQQGESVTPEAPLFVSRSRNKDRRLSARQLSYAFSVWQERAGFERHFNFHALRHTAITALYRSTRDIHLTARYARHRSLTSTAIYLHGSDEELARAVRDLFC